MLTPKGEVRLEEPNASGRERPRYLGDGAHSFGASFSEHQLLVTVQVLGSLDEAEVNRGLVARPQTVFVHGEDGGGLPDAAAVNWGDNKREGQFDSPTDS